MIQRIRSAFVANERYPCTKQSYSDLLEHPIGKEAKYRESVTNASVLYPLLASIAALLRTTSFLRTWHHFKEKLCPTATFSFGSQMMPPKTIFTRIAIYTASHCLTSVCRIARKNSSAAFYGMRAVSPILEAVLRPAGFVAVSSGCLPTLPLACSGTSLEKVSGRRPKALKRTTMPGRTKHLFQILCPRERASGHSSLR